MRKITFPRINRLSSVGFMLIMFTFSLAVAQNEYEIQFQGETINIPENISSFQWQELPEHASLASGYYNWIQFYETPTQEVQDNLKSQGVALLDYISEHTYLTYTPSNIPVSLYRNSNVRGISAVEGSVKLSEALKSGDYPSYALEGDNIIVTLEYHEKATLDFVVSDLARKQISVQQQYKGANILDLVIPNNCLEELSNLAYVKWVELIVAPSVKDDTRGRSLHRSSGLDTQTGAGRNYTGAGIGVMVRDDGIVGPHIDFQGRIDNSGASGSGQTHGDGVGGIMAGAGNLNPDNRGMAAGSNVFIVNYNSSFLDSQTTNLINSGDVQVTNSSYSNGCNAGYTTITRTVDQQTRNIPSLLHVFSAGNSNNNNCGYGAGSQWGNITGGHKQGKNVIATANVFFDGSLVNSSSRGPAHDGRIKPDITAHGQNQISTDENNGYLTFGGTSGAAPGIAGVAAQLYELYGNENGGALPPSALIKAALLNTANEAGNIGPDFRFGWGIVNGLRAGMLLENDQFLSDDIAQGATNTHSISIPSGTAQVRFMVYWSDPEASSGANTALVNDLDMVVTDPSNGTLMPWILDSTPNAGALNTPATTGEDHLNNMEQVLINNPAAGTYDIDISGFNVPMGPQEYFVVYEIIEDNLTVTYPNHDEKFTVNQTESIHWDGINLSGTIDLEYSTDNGTSWNAIASIAASNTNYAWQIPNEISGQAKIRVTNGSFVDESDEPFSIALRPNNLQFTQVCPTEATFTWNAVPDAEEYDIYILGAQFMEVAGSSTTTEATVPIADGDMPVWAAIVAKNNTEGWSSKRTVAINHGGGLLNCVLANDLAISTNNGSGDFSTVCSGSSDVVVSVNVQNTGGDAQDNFTVSYQLDSGAVVSQVYTETLDAGQTVTIDFTTPLSIGASGDYTLALTLDLAGDQNPNNDTDALSFYAVTQATALNFIEPFEANGFPPASWTIDNPDAATTWTEITGINGSAGSATNAAYVNNFNYDAAGQEDAFVTELFDLTGAQDVALTFDLAKAQYSTTLFDTLRVEVSIDCGTTFENIYEKTNLELSTIGGYTTNNWLPASESDWRTEEVSLTPYEGEIVQFRFVNITGFGNGTFIDNVEVRAGLLGTQDVSLGTIAMYPNPASDKVTIALSETTASNYTVTLTNSLGQRLATYGPEVFVNNKANISVASLSNGIYFVTVEAGKAIKTMKLVVQ